jgi:hypothetical protein
VSINRVSSAGGTSASTDVAGVTYGEEASISGITAATNAAIVLNFATQATGTLTVNEAITAPGTGNVLIQSTRGADTSTNPAGLSDLIVNNTVNAGVSVVTGHLHSLKVTPFADYNGNRFGVDTGTLAETDGPQFTYAEINPSNHRSGFAVLNFFNGRLLWPELVHKFDEDMVEFRGEVIDVGEF